MPAANTDKLRKATPNFAKYITAGISGADTTIPLSSVTGLPTDTAVELTIDGAIAASKEVVIGVVSGTNLINCLRGQDGTSAQAHSINAAVTDWNTAHHWNDMINWALVAHNQDGTLKSGLTLTSPTVSSPSVTGGTYSSPAITTPKIITSLNDTNANELLRVTATGSAVNDLTLANAATGAGPTLTATGDDANIFWKAAGKGTGFFVPQVKLLTATITNTGTTEAVAATLTVPSVPFATNVLLMGWAYADLGAGAPTQDWQHRIRRGTTTAGTGLTFSNVTKSSATSIGQQSNTSMMFMDPVAANTSTSYVWTVSSTTSVATAGQFIALVFAQ
jgi:hypothetical protein